MIDLKNNYTEMIDLNGIPILRDSLLKHEEGDTIVISRASEIYDRRTTGAIVFVFPSGFCKNPCEVEVVTKEEAVLIAFEEDGVILDF